MLKGSLQGSQLITEDPKYLTRINVDNALFSEDSDSISFYSAAQAGIKVLVIANNVNRTPNKPFQEVFSIHEQEGIRGLCLNKNIDITAFMVFTTGNWPKKSKRLDAIVVSERTATTLQNVYVICLAHAPFLFLVANIGFFSEKKIFQEENVLLGWINLHLLHEEYSNPRSYLGSSTNRWKCDWVSQKARTSQGVGKV